MSVNFNEFHIRLSFVVAVPASKAPPPLSLLMPAVRQLTEGIFSDQNACVTNINFETLKIDGPVK